MDFVHKMAISQKEANKTLYWLELLYKTDYITESVYTELSEKLIQIQKIITAIIKTSKKN
jgi:four helix bundle protein